MTILYWVLNGTGKWHAWPMGGRRAYCGRVNVEHLRLHPAKQISQALPEDADVCASCVKKSGVIIGRPCTDSTSAAWIVVLRLRLRRAHISVADASIEQFAALLAEAGSPDEVAAREVYEEVQLLLLKPTWTRKGTRSFVTLPHLKEALAKLPPKTGVLLRVAETVRVWRHITCGDLAVENFRPERVIETLLQIPSPEPYIRHLNARGLPHFAAMFHPNTLARAKKEPTLRGLFSGSNKYWDNTVSQLNIVAD